jgi:Mannosyl-glycoprotein endo-beta-N-acetylglucosaminidase
MRARPVIRFCTGVLMTSFVSKAVALSTLGLSVALSPAANASSLPSVKIDSKNAAPACATPGRMMAYLASRNPSLDPRFKTIAVDYMKIGEDLAIRWDYAFFQMLLETSDLSFKREGRNGDLKITQNNFAGLKSTGAKSEQSESFPDVASGVKAHIQHVLVYAGEKVDNAVADRTRKVQEWGVLKSWQKSIKGPITFADVAKKWASNGTYGQELETAAKGFYDSICDQPDPKPELMAMVRKGTAVAAVLPATPAAVDAPSADAFDDDKPAKISGAALAKKAVADAKAEGNSKRTGLGAANIAKSAQAAEPPKAQQAVTLLNPGADIAPAATTPAVTPSAKAPETSTKAPVQNASAGGLARSAGPAPAAPGSKCRVWTASYGGQKAVIIKSSSDGMTNYTVLDVNDGTEKREADTYISAYAKGGVQVAEFASQTQALDKAFDLCPEN